MRLVTTGNYRCHDAQGCRSATTAWTPQSRCEHSEITSFLQPVQADLSALSEITHAGIAVSEASLRHAPILAPARHMTLCFSWR